MLSIHRNSCGICIFALLMNTFPFSVAVADDKAAAQNAIATSPEAKAAAVPAEELVKNSQTEKKISNDIGSFMNSMFAHDHQSVVALPPEILFYTKKFADQVFLRQITSFR